MLIMYIFMLVVNAVKEAAFRRTQAQMTYKPHRTKSKPNLTEREKQALRAKYKYDPVRNAYASGWTGKYNDIW